MREKTLYIHKSKMGHVFNLSYYIFNSKFYQLLYGELSKKVDKKI